MVAPNGVIAMQWRDLVAGPSGVCVATLGAAPSRRWVAQWDGARYYSDSSSALNFEVIGHEGSGLIDFAYGAMSSASNSTLGLENPAGTQAVSLRPSGSSCSVITNIRTRFTRIS